MAERTGSGGSPSSRRSPARLTSAASPTHGKSTSPAAAQRQKSATSQRSRAKSATSQGKPQSAKSDANRRNLSKSPQGRQRSADKQKRSRSRSPEKVKSRASSSKRSVRSAARSERSQASDEKESKASSSATGKRVMANAGEITKLGLKIADMAGQGLTFVANSTFQMKNVGILDLSCNNIRNIPADIKKMTSLIHIDLSKNGLRCLHAGDYGGIPAELATLPNLTILIISECNLPHIPPVIFKCINLTILDISRNKINILLPEIGNLEQLQHLNAQSTNISTLPPEIAFCQELEELLLWGNVIESLPETMREMPKLKQLAINYRSFYTILDTYMDNLLKKGQIQSEHIPPVVFEMPGLDTLDLEGTKINHVPDRCYGQLRELYLQNNYFRSTPTMILNLPTLQVLNISSNMLDQLPDDIGRLCNLVVLKANDNDFSVLSPSIGQLTKLEQLALGGNQLDVIPDSIGQLKQLRSLILDRNKLTAIPETIVALTKLHTLDLSENLLQTLPSNFYEMQSLVRAHVYQNFYKAGLWLHKNPLSTPPRHIWQTEDPKQIYTYMKKLRIMKTENLNRQKLILLGAHQSGKTSLMRTLSMGKSFLTDAGTDSTRLVGFRAWCTENHVDFMLTDLGGDEIYVNALHLFLDPKALYLLVYDHRSYTPQKHEAAIGRWLDLLYMYVPGAVVKIVGTQCDLACDDINEKIREQVRDRLDEQLRSYAVKIKHEITCVNERIEKSSSGSSDGELARKEIALLKRQKARLLKLGRSPLRVHHDIAMVDCSEAVHGIQSLIQALEVMAVNKELFPHAQREIPPGWQDMRHQLHKSKAYCMTLKQVNQMAKAHNINATDCLKYLHDVGDILWYDTYPVLRDVIFTKPRKLVETFNSLFNHTMDQVLDYDTNRILMAKGDMDKLKFETAKENFLTSGLVSRDLLKALWFYENLSYDQFNYLVELIPSFNMCYTIPQSEIPLHYYDYQPLMVIPLLIRDVQPPDISHLWSELPEPSVLELGVSMTFPMFYPSGLLEKFSCRVQDYVYERTDWQDLIRADMDQSTLLITRGLDPETYDCVLKVRIRGRALDTVKRDLGTIYEQLKLVVEQYAGLVWYLELTTQNCEKYYKVECFPDAIFTDCAKPKH